MLCKHVHINSRRFDNLPPSAVPLSRPSWPSIPAPLPPHSSADVSAFLPKAERQQDQRSCINVPHVHTSATHLLFQPELSCTVHIQPAVSHDSPRPPSVSPVTPETKENTFRTSSAGLRHTRISELQINVAHRRCCAGLSLLALLAESLLCLLCEYL